MTLFCICIFILLRRLYWFRFLSPSLLYTTKLLSMVEAEYYEEYVEKNSYVFNVSDNFFGSPINSHKRSRN